LLVWRRKKITEGGFPKILLGQYPRGKRKKVPRHIFSRKLVLNGKKRRGIKGGGEIESHGSDGGRGGDSFRRGTLSESRDELQYFGEEEFKGQRSTLVLGEEIGDGRRGKKFKEPQEEKVREESYGTRGADVCCYG